MFRRLSEPARRSCVRGKESPEFTDDTEMNTSLRKARGALLVALGFAASTIYPLNSAMADETPLHSALQLTSTSVQPVAYGAILDEEEAESNGEDAKENGESSLEERFKAIDETFESLEESIDEVAEIAGDSQIVKSGSSKSTMVVSGRVHVDAWGFDTKDDTIANMNETSSGNPLDPQNRLGFRRLRFGVKGKIKDNMEYKIEMEFAGGNSSEFRDAYLGWNELPILGTLLLGNQKRPYGLDHLNSSRYNVFLERPFVIEANNQDARRLGLAAYNVSANQRWNWRYGVYNQRNVQGLGNYIDDHLQLEITGRLANTIWYDDISDGRGYAHWAISGSHADADPVAVNGNEARYRTRPEGRSSNRWIDTGRIAGADYQDLIGLEGVVNVGALQVVGEYQSVWVNRFGNLPTPNFNGGYVYAAYFLTGEHMPWDRKSGTLARPKPFQNFWLVDLCNGGRAGGWGAWQVAARYSIADYSDEDIFGGKGESFTFGLNWYWNPNARMQFNYITGEIEDRGTASAGIVDGDYDVWGARFMVDF
jgi:phosphate-selective porin OprO/OprP